MLKERKRGEVLWEKGAGFGASVLAGTGIQSGALERSSGGKKKKVERAPGKSSQQQGSSPSSLGKGLG